MKLFIILNSKRWVVNLKPDDYFFPVSTNLDEELLNGDPS